MTLGCEEDGGRLFTFFLARWGLAAALLVAEGTSHLSTGLQQHLQSSNSHFLFPSCWQDTEPHLAGRATGLFL